MRDHKIYVVGVPALVASMNGHLLNEIFVDSSAGAPEINVESFTLLAITSLWLS